MITTKNMVDKKDLFIEYKPSTAVIPGETLLEVLESKNMKQAELAARIGMSQKHINEIVNGKTSITSETAIQLEKALGIPARFWATLESDYQEILARHAEEKYLIAEAKEAKEYPYNEMEKWGWVPKVKDQLQRTKNLLSFFGVSTLGNIIEKNSLQSVLYRISTKRHYSIPAIVTWLRKGVIDSENVSTSPYDETKFKETIQKIRNLVVSGLDTFKSEAPSFLSDCGVAFVVTPNLKNAPINGATRWLSADKALIQLSLRNKFADIFWFSLFHELGHLVLHGKRDVNVDFVNGDGNLVDRNKEQEVDEYAKNILLSKNHYNEFVGKGNFTIQSIVSFAKKAEVFPGIVIGRLQHDKLIPMGKYTYLRDKYDWVTAEEKIL